MEKSWLVQRLLKPFKSETNSTKDILFNANPFAFGGGYKNGGFDEEAYKIINQIFNFDYMGSAEFEFGDVPKSFGRILKDSSNYFGDSSIFSWEYKHWGEKETKKGNSKIFYLCTKPQEKDVKQTITEFAMGKGETKESVRLDYTLSNPESHSRNPCGWIDIINDFLFFTDEEMWKDTAQILGIKLS